MNKLFKRPLWQRITAVLMSLFISISLLNSDLYFDIARSVFGVDETVTPSVHAADNIIYDAGTMKLSAYYGGSYHSTKWQASDVTSSIGGDMSLPTTVIAKHGGASALNVMMCYSDYMGNIWPSLSNPNMRVSDYLAPAPGAPGTDSEGGLMYRYIAKGTVTFTDTDYVNGDIVWEIRAWPLSQAWANDVVPITTKAAAQAEWNNMEQDLVKEKDNLVKATKSDSDLNFKSQFSKARPIWESGNTNYADWYSALENGDSGVHSESVVYGKSLKWMPRGGQPWLHIELPYPASSTRYMQVLTAAHDDVNNAIYDGSGSFYANAQGYVMATRGGTDGYVVDPINAGYGLTLSDAGVVQPLTNLDGNGRFDVASVLSNAFTGVTVAHSNQLVNGAHSAHYNGVYIKSAEDQIVDYYTNHASTWTDGKGAPTGYRLYGIWVKAQSNSGDTKSEWIFGKKTLANNNMLWNERFDVNDGSGTGYLNANPLFDITYDYQRSAGTVTGSLHSTLESIESTTAVIVNDDDTTTKTGFAVPDTVVKDTVVLSGLTVGNTYTIDGTIYVYDPDSHVVTTAVDTGTFTFEAASTAANPSVVFNFDATPYKDKTLVCYEVLKDSNGNALSEHKVATDVAQQVSFVEKVIVYTETITRTVALDVTTKTHQGIMDESSSIQDTVFMSGLEGGKPYMLTASVYAITGDDVEFITSVDDHFTTGASTVPLTMARTVTIPNIDTSEYDGKKFVVYEQLSNSEGTLVAEHCDKTDANQTVTYKSYSDTITIDSTEALDRSTMSHEGVYAASNGVDGDCVIIDTINYSGAVPGREYILRGQLYYAKNGIVRPIPNAKIEESYTALTANGSFQVEYEDFLDEIYVGYPIVVCESFYVKKSDKEYKVASHENYNDEDQTVTYKSIYDTDKSKITSTELLDGYDNAHVSLGRSDGFLVDTVTYSDLTPNVSYYLAGQLYALDRGTIKAIPGSYSNVTFTPLSPTGSQDVEFEFDTRNYIGKKIVAYEYLYRTDADAKFIASHANPNDEDQQVSIVAIDQYDKARIVKTTALASNTNAHVGGKGNSSSASYVINDTVEFKDATIGQKYVLKPSVYDITSGVLEELVSPDATVGTAFTPNTRNGKVVVKINLPGDLEGKKLVVYEALYRDDYPSVVISEHKDMSDVLQQVVYPEMTTDASVVSFGGKETEPVKGDGIKDHIVLSNLYVGHKYRLTGSILDASSMSPFTQSGAPVVTSIDFEPEDTTYECDMLFNNIDLTSAKGVSLYVSQQLEVYDGSAWKVVLVDKSGDKSETIKVTSPSVVTNLIDKETGFHDIYPTTSTKMTDRVSYTGLQADKMCDYKIVTKIKTLDGKPVIIDGKELSGETIVNNHRADTLEADVDIVFDATPFTDDSLVAYNYLYRVSGGKEYLVISEEDASNVNQKANFPGDVSIDTIALVASTGKHNTVAADSVNVNDYIAYTGLKLGGKYVFSTKVWDVNTGSYLDDVDIKTPMEVTSMTGMITIPITMNCSSREGHTLVVYERLFDSKGNVVATHEIAEMASQAIYVDEPTLTTKAYSADTESKNVPCSDYVVITDEMHYTGLVPGRTYTVQTELYDKNSKKMLTGAYNNHTTTFTPKASYGIYELTMNASTYAAAGHDLVVYETFMEDGGRVVCEHKDPNDKDQTVHVIKPTIDTVATGSSTSNTKKVACEDDSVIYDTVHYTGLDPESYYALVTSVYDYKTGKPLELDSNGLDDDDEEEDNRRKSSSTSSSHKKRRKEKMMSLYTGFYPDAESGSITVEIPIDTRSIPGKDVVVFERLERFGTLIASHEDINDADQMVTINEPELDTVATSVQTGGHTAPFGTKVIIRDRVKYEHLEKDEPYTLITKLYDATAGMYVEDVDEIETEIKPDKSHGEEVVSLTVDTTNLIGHRLVVYQELELDGVRVASHKKNNDYDQSVTVATPSLGSLALDAKSATHTMAVGAGDDATMVTMGASFDSDNAASTQQDTAGSIKEKVYYSGLNKGDSYNLKTVVYDRITGLEVNDIEPIDTSFTATGSSGEVTVAIPVNMDANAGKVLVVTETLTVDDTVGATHIDLGDASQTVYVASLDTILTSMSEQTPKDVGVSSAAVLVDTVKYSGLEPGVTYTITGTIMNYDAVTGQVSRPAGEDEGGGDYSMDYRPDSYSVVEEEPVETSSDTENTENTDGGTYEYSSDYSSSDASGSESVDDGSAQTEDTSVSDESNGVSETESSDINADTSSSGNNNASSPVNNSNFVGITNRRNSIANNESEPDGYEGEDGGYSSEEGDDGEYEGESTPGSSSKLIYGANMAQIVGTATMTFTPTSESGVLQIPFSVNTSDLQGHRLVAYETITKGKKIVVAEKDINNVNQTVTVTTQSGSSWKTGIETYSKHIAVIASILLLLAAMIIGLFIRRRRRMS